MPTMEHVQFEDALGAAAVEAVRFLVSSMKNIPTPNGEWKSQAEAVRVQAASALVEHYARLCVKGGYHP